MPFRLLLLLCGLAVAPPAAGQLVDTVFTWESYGPARSSCRLRLYRAAADTHTTHVALLDEIAANRGASAAEDLRFLAEAVARSFRLDPARTRWVVRWGPFSFPGAEPGPKELLLAASLHRLKNRRLGTPSWKLVSREEVEAWTDRAFR